MAAQAKNAFEVGAGVITTTGFLQRDASSGPFVRFGLARLNTAQVPSHRLDLEIFMLRKGPHTIPDGMPQRSMNSLGISYSRLVSLTKTSAAPYVLFGAVIQGIQEVSTDAYPGAIGGLRGGLGYRRKFSTVTLALEASYQLGVFALSNGLHNTRDGSVLPVTLSVRF